MKVFFLFSLIINTVFFSSVVSALQIFDPENIEWLEIENFNETDFVNLQKRAYENQIKPLNFYRGVDISSIISLENSGIKFYNPLGQEQDIFQILANVGVNCIRVRIWNSPKTTSGKLYGGGNNDLEVARAIGSRAARYGLSLFVNFHYSDFWADPTKQHIPKEWKNFDLDKRIFEIYRFTKGCLEWLLENGSIISMVQVGNETNSFMCGEKDMNNVMKMMSNGIKAVRDVSKNIVVVLHFSNPNKSDTMLWYASQLASARVDYDVFASSYYPYWHGTYDNLKNVLNKIANSYGKKILIAEYSYLYTDAALTDDRCYYGLISSQTSNVSFPYSFSVEGQTQCIKDIYKTIREIKNGIGAFYWEPAWIAPKARNDAERRQIWEKYGSGWASQPAAEYDSDVDKNKVGGTTWDNQAVFTQNGKPTDSLYALGEISAAEGIAKFTNNSGNSNNNNNNNNDECFSIKLGYPCCQGNIVYYVDNDGQWGFENNNWCGMKSNINQNASSDCTGKAQGYQCCASCNIYMTDADGRWGIENGNWCGIKNSC